MSKVRQEEFAAERGTDPGLWSPLNQPSFIRFKIPTVHGVSLECYLIRFHMYQYKHSSVCIFNVFIYCMQEWMSCRVLEEYLLIQWYYTSHRWISRALWCYQDPKIELILSHSLNLIFVSYNIWPQQRCQKYFKLLYINISATTAYGKYHTYFKSFWEM